MGLLQIYHQVLLVEYDTTKIIQERAFNILKLSYKNSSLLAKLLNMAIYILFTGHSQYSPYYPTFYFTCGYGDWCCSVYNPRESLWLFPRGLICYFIVVVHLKHMFEIYFNHSLVLLILYYKPCYKNTDTWLQSATHKITSFSERSTQQLQLPNSRKIRDLKAAKCSKEQTMTVQSAKPCCLNNGRKWLHLFMFVIYHNII